MGKIGRSWRLMKISIGVVKKDKEILIFPIISMIISAIIFLTFIFGFFFLGISGGNIPDFSYFWILPMFILYLILYFVVIYFNTAVIGCAYIRLKGGDPTVGDGFEIANQHIGKIFQWALISATVGVILQIIRQRAGILGKIASSLLGFAWTYATFFIIPVIIFEEQPVWTSVKRSASLFKQTWGETFVGSLGFGIIFFLLGILGIFPIIIGAILFGIAGLIAGFIIAIIYWLFISAVASATQGIYVTALYQYATEKKLPSAFDMSVIPPPISH